MPDIIYKVVYSYIIKDLLYIFRFLCSMNRMRRKTIQLAGKTLVVSLPSTWVRLHGIKKGEELEVSEHGPAIVVEPVRQEKGSSIVVDISGLNASLVWHAVVWKYVAGFSQIEVRFKDHPVRDPRSGVMIHSADAVERALEGLIGMEVVRQAGNSMTIREVSSIIPEEYQMIVRRVWLTCLSMMEDSAKAVSKKDYAAFQTAVKVEKNVNRLVLYSLRMLHRGVASNVSEALKDSRLLYALENVADALVALSKMHKVVSKPQAMDATVKLFRSAYDSWFSASNEKTELMYGNLVGVRQFLGDSPHLVLACEQVVEAVAARIAGDESGNVSA